jgi:PAS domain S-box-containing protein
MSRMTLTLIGRQAALWVFALVSGGVLLVGALELLQGIARTVDLWGYATLAVAFAALHVLVRQERLGLLLAQRVGVVVLLAFLLVSMGDVWLQAATGDMNHHVAATAVPWMMGMQLMLFLCLPARPALLVAWATACALLVMPWLAAVPPDVLASVKPTLINGTLAQLIFGLLLYAVATQVHLLAGNGVPVGHGPRRAEMSVGDFVSRRERELKRLLARAEAAHRTAAAHEAELRAMLDAFPGIVLRVEANGVFSFANEHGAHLFGLQPAELMGRHARELVGAAAFSRSTARSQQILASGQPVTFETTVTRDDGTANDLLMTQFVVKSAAGGQFVTYQIGVDIGERKRAEQALALAKQVAERANTAKSHFMSRMSHELRTPLNAVLGLAQLLRSQAHSQTQSQANQLSEQQHSHLRTIADAGKELLMLVDETMDLSRMDSGDMRVNCQPLNLTELVASTLSSVAPLAQAQGVHLAPPPVPRVGARALWVQGDPVRLRQVLINLLSNAIKYNRAGGGVAVRVASRGNQAQLVVQDSGQGMSPQQQAQLFQPYNRLGAEHTNTPGTGIGLSISRGLVTLMNGQLDVRSQPGVGTEFLLWLPLAEAPAAQPNTAARSDFGALDENSGVQGKLLYVEDNDVNILVFEACLARRPQVQVCVARDADEALAWVQREPFDLAVLDLNLGSSNGLDLADVLRLQPRMQGVPLVLLTADATPEAAAQAHSRGITQVWHKPFDAARLLSNVDSLLRQTIDA